MGLNQFFTEFLEKESIFINKKILQSNYEPDNILHREKQVDQVADILAPSLKMDKPSNLFIYGKTGTGKTCVIKHVTNELINVAKERGVNLEVLYLNCKLKKIADTEYRLVAQMARELGVTIPATGLPTDEVYKMFFNEVDKKSQLILIILDEIDHLLKKTGDEILYNVTRANSDLKHAQISIVGISNDLVFVDHLDPRVKSSLSEEEIVFPPYNAMQIQEILRNRSEKAFVKEAISPGVIEKCSAYAAREHGDARRALELLRVSAELAERRGSKSVHLEDIDHAEEKLERDRIVDVITTQPKQHQTTLYSVINVCLNKTEHVFTGEIYDFYKAICNKVGLRPLTQRRVSDIIAELDMLGIINAKVISKGRYGRTREISLSLQTKTNPKIKKILEDSLEFS